MDRSDSNIDLCLETDSASTTSENASCVSENRPSYEGLRKQLIEMERGLKRAQLPTLKNRCLQDVCTLMYKAKHKLCLVYISNICNTHSTSYSLRQTDFSIPRYNTVTYDQHSRRYLGPKLWAKLPKHIRSAKTLKAILESLMPALCWTTVICVVLAVHLCN